MKQRTCKIANVVLALIVVCLLILLFQPTAVVPPSRPGDLDWRWIGEGTADMPCEPGFDLLGWRATPLFPNSPSPALAAFCVYEKSAGRVSDEEVIHLGEQHFSRDRVAFSPSASDLTLATWQALRQQFRSQVDGIEVPTGAEPPNVRLALLDTAPTGDAPHATLPLSTRSPHGYTLANLARELLCSAQEGLQDGLQLAKPLEELTHSEGEEPEEAHCLAEVTAQLALPVVKYNQDNPEISVVDTDNGGFVGRFSDLTAAVEAEVGAWLDNTDQALVLNLSIAWNPQSDAEADPEDPESLPEAQKLVYLALEHAACRGALVVAAAGNASGGPNDDGGPLLPAAWERLPAPNAERCSERHGVTIPPPPYEISYRPFLYAVGGVQSDDQALANARPGGMPRLVAYGDHAVTAGAPFAAPTAVLTGSSVSALAVSATAAAVWQVDTAWSAHRVMDVIYQAGYSLMDGEQQVPADFYLKTAPTPERRRISLCQAVKSACGISTECITDLQPEACMRSWNGQPLHLSGLDRQRVTALGFQQVIPPGKSWKKVKPEGCKPKNQLTYSYPSYPKGKVPTGLRFCPFQKLPGAENGPLGPQPRVDPCPTCLYFGDTGSLVGEIESVPGTLTEPTLIVGTDSYGLPDLVPLEPGDQFELSGFPLAQGQTVWLEFTVDGNQSVLTSVLSAN